jgi:hypothetical protein
MEGHTRNGSLGFDVPRVVHQPPQIFGSFNSDGSPAQPVLPGPVFQDHGDVGSADDNDPKRRRIARVCATGHDCVSNWTSLLMGGLLGMRHVSEEENQM